MPKSGLAQQWCVCGSNLRPHIALYFAARSLHVSPRVRVAETTVYVCSRCVAQFEKAMEQQGYFFRSVNPTMRDRILGAIAGSIVTVWENIRELVPDARNSHAR